MTKTAYYPTHVVRKFFFRHIKKTFTMVLESWISELGVVVLHGEVKTQNWPSVFSCFFRACMVKVAGNPPKRKITP